MKSLFTTYAATAVTSNDIVPTTTTSNAAKRCRHVIGFSLVKLILEVFGAAGAVWGSSDVFNLRNSNPIPTKSYTTNDIVRLLCMFTLGVFTIRFYFITKHYLKHNYEYLPMETQQRHSYRWAFVQMFAVRFVLQVMGGCGAVWGCAEVVTLRNDYNKDSWRMIAAIVGIMFLIRWMLQILSYCFIMGMLPNSCIAKFIAWMELFVVKVVLEVFGGAGAIWGCSEILTLRTDDTISIWRSVAVATLFAFTIRWLIIVFQFIASQKEEKKPAHRGSDNAVEEDAEIEDLSLTETDTFSAT